MKQSGEYVAYYLFQLQQRRAQGGRREWLRRAADTRLADFDDQVVLRGMRIVNEVVFEFSASKFERGQEGAEFFFAVFDFFLDNFEHFLVRPFPGFHELHDHLMAFGAHDQSTSIIFDFDEDGSLAAVRGWVLIRFCLGSHLPEK
jgi:hypothetical protein